jgi:hypothetical protein
MTRSRDDGEYDAHADEKHGEDGRRAGQEVGGAACRHQARGTAAHAQSPALGSLHQDDRNQRKGDDGLDDKEKGEQHGRSEYPEWH